MLTRLIDFLKVAADHRALHQPDLRRRSPGEDRRGHLLAGGHLAAAAGHRAGRRAQPGDVHPQVARHGPLQPDPRVPADRPGHRAAGRVPRAGRRAHRVGAAGAGGPREGRRRCCGSRRSKRKQRELERKREALEARIAALRKEFEAEEEEAKRLDRPGAGPRAKSLSEDREAMGRSRQADDGPSRRARSRKTPGGRK